MSAGDRVPAVSVVAPCYNGGPFIDQLLEALASQTFRDFEIIIVDDGSDRATRAKLATLDPSVRVIHQTNQGPAAARNTGFRHARADLVLAIDCDDLIEPSYLAETVAALRAATPEVGFAVTYERKVGRRVGHVQSSFKLFDQLFTNRLSSCMLVRREAWQAVGGYDERMREGYEDWEFTVALGKAGYRCIVIPKTLFIYCTRGDGLMMSRSFRLHAELWRRMRVKHSELYRLPALLKLWWCTRSEPGWVSLPRALGLLGLATFLPDRWFSALVFSIRRRRLPDPTPVASPPRMSTR
jgi:glycosyltransferase involved in cell wall biosynthesis